MFGGACDDESLSGSLEKQHEGSQIERGRAVDKAPAEADDTSMRATTDKDYIDSRLETISTRMLGEVRAIMAEMAGERKSFEAKTDANIRVIRELLDRKLAESNANLQKTIADLLKWLTGIMITLVGVSLGYMTFLVNNAVLRSAPAPIVIYAQPPTAPPNKVEVAPPPPPAAQATR